MDNIEVASGSPLPGVKVIILFYVQCFLLCQRHSDSPFFCPSSYVFLSVLYIPKQPQQLGDVIKIPKETIEIFKNQVFGFDTFFVTSQDPYEVCAYLSSISFCTCTKVQLHDDRVLLFLLGWSVVQGKPARASF